MRGAGRDVVPGAYPGGGAWAGRTEESELSENGTGTDDDGGTQDAVLLFVGGPLDGRVEVRPARHGDPLPTITHVHLHDGPKVVHRYDLHPLPGQAGVYHLRAAGRTPAATPTRPPAQDEHGD